MEKFYYCQSEIEFREKCKQACDHCKIYYYPLEQERKMEDLKEWADKEDYKEIADHLDKEMETYNKNMEEQSKNFGGL